MMLLYDARRIAEDLRHHFERQLFIQKCTEKDARQRNVMLFNVRVETLTGCFPTKATENVQLPIQADRR
jgi:hypothetical protein